ncbi:MAG: DUF6314 family protein [Pseudomonadota bacterium]
MVPMLAEFEGLWRLARGIEDRRAAQQGTLIGEAVFTSDPDPESCLRYEETGALSYAGQSPLNASRRYVWRAAKEHSIEVLFDDGRPFHTISRDRLMPDATHHCAPDMYYVSYDFTGWPDWSSSWRVLGPQKDYRMRSEYSRL